MGRRFARCGQRSAPVQAAFAVGGIPAPGGRGLRCCPARRRPEPDQRGPCRRSPAARGGCGTPRTSPGGSTRPGDRWLIRTATGLCMRALLSEAGEKFRPQNPAAGVPGPRPAAAQGGECGAGPVGFPGSGRRTASSLGCGEAEPAAAEVRLDYASQLGWVGGLVIGMLSQLEAARDDPHMAGRSPGRVPRGRDRGPCT